MSQTPPPHSYLGHLHMSLDCRQHQAGAVVIVCTVRWAAALQQGLHPHHVTAGTSLRHQRRRGRRRRGGGGISRVT